MIDILFGVALIVAGICIMIVAIGMLTMNFVPFDSVLIKIGIGALILVSGFFVSVLGIFLIRDSRW